MITINKAIETITEYLKPVSSYKEVDLREALNLGIEALKAVERSRRLWGSRGVETLPGEVKDNQETKHHKENNG